MQSPTCPVPGMESMEELFHQILSQSVKRMIEGRFRERLWILRNHKLTKRLPYEEEDSVLRKAVIPAAGLGTRLLSLTKRPKKAGCLR
jgi:hypothetical protein